MAEGGGGVSDILRSRLRDCLDNYGVPPGRLLDLDELAAELLNFTLPVTDAEFADEPIWHQLVSDNLGRCMNCLCLREDCGCCPGCGEPDADMIGSHGYWCAL